jgi:CRP/FNR family cyclic AMP-dependent transcriptional regulator
MARSQTSELEYTLAAVNLFANLLPAALKPIHESCSCDHYRPGQPIVHYLDDSNDVYFVSSGEVSVTIYSASGTAVSFRDLGPGTTFGEYAAIDGGPRSASVVAKTECVIASMGADRFRELLQSEPLIGKALIRELVNNLRSLTNRVYEFSTLAVNNRIQAELLRLAKAVPREGKSARIVPPPKHAEIASRISTHREAVTRELNRLSREGLIERQSGVLVIRDVDRLAAMLHEMTGE